MTTDYEKLGVFYLGRGFDAATRTIQPEPGLYEAKDLTTHAVCVGMTGSGKTGLCVSLLEEAAIDGIPVLAIDPKGDLGAFHRNTTECTGRWSREPPDRLDRHWLAGRLCHGVFRASLQGLAEPGKGNKLVEHTFRVLP